MYRWFTYETDGRVSILFWNYFLFSTDSTDKLVVQGGVEDMRNAIFSLAHINTIPEEAEAVTSIPEAIPIPGSNRSYIVRDIDFYFKLNHTRLLTSRLLWRPELKQELLVGNPL